jgi:hypothetical protein
MENKAGPPRAAKWFLTSLLHLVSFHFTSLTDLPVGSIFVPCALKGR